MRVGVLTLEQLGTAEPAHYTSRRFANFLLSNRYARAVKRTATGLVARIQLTVKKSWAEIKQQMRLSSLASEIVVRPPYEGPRNLNLTYPAPEQTSYRHPYQNLVDRCRAVKAAQKAAAKK